MTVEIELNKELMFLSTGGTGWLRLYAMLVVSAQGIFRALKLEDF